MTGVDPDRLDDQQLMKELETIHRTRHDTLLHGSNEALRTHNLRMAQLEGSTCAAIRAVPSPRAVPATGPGSGASRRSAERRVGAT